MTFKGLVRSHVKGKYGQYYLVQTVSGRWSAVWWCFLQEDLDRGAFHAIVTENTEWFDNQITFAQVPSYATKKEALQKILEGTEDEGKHSGGMAEYFEVEATRIRKAIRRAERSSTLPPSK